MTGHSAVMPINSVIGNNLDVSVQPLVVGFGLLLVLCLLVTLFALLADAWGKKI
ncbi:hypothetical protein NVV56_08050 [Aeromonas dhakensis]|uniref:hypothetical protein n=1 Tax=Aeromonas dhakensis TaxID=196024 RepID=UPI0021583D72|nr:hypothetical protein [Aeromonas dhakensis]MCR6738849.1 hypothetical protein [Aeromonas dhakensis]